MNIESALSDLEKWESDYWGKPTESRKRLNKRAKDKRYYRRHKKECDSKNKKYISEHAEQRRETNRRYYRNHSDKESRRMREYISNNREKYIAHLEVQKAIKKGILFPEVCSECGAAKTEAHHDDYNSPLSVRWLCHKCHMKFHAEERSKQ